MKIGIRSGKFGFSFYLPLRLSAWAIGNYLTGKQNKKHAGAEKLYPGKKNSDAACPSVHTVQNSMVKAPETPLFSLRALTKELKKARRTFGHLKIVDVKSANGDSFEITL